MKQQHEIGSFLAHWGRCNKSILSTILFPFHQFKGCCSLQLQVGLLLMVRIVDFYRKRMQQRKVLPGFQRDWDRKQTQKWSTWWMQMYGEIRYGRICHSDVIQRVLFESHSCKFIYTTGF